MRIFVPSSATLLTDTKAHGEGLIAWRLLSGLASRGHHIVACAREVDIAAEPPFEVVETGRLTPLESIEPLAQSRRVAREFERRGGARAFDLAHWIFPPSMDDLAFTAGIPFVYGPHALEWPDERRRPRPGDAIRAVLRPLLRRRSRRALASARLLLFAVPEATAAFPVDPGERAGVLPFGVDEERFRPAPLPGRPTLLFVANLEPRKRADLLLDAFAQLRTPEVRLVVAGTGSQETELRLQAERLGVAARVDWRGNVPHAAMPALLAESSLVCSASVGEPYGMALLEAMAAGRAVVAIDAGGPRFLVDRGHGGALVWPPTAAALASALDELLADSTRLEAAGRWNRERVERELTWTRILDRLEAFYADAVG